MIFGTDYARAVEALKGKDAVTIQKEIFAAEVAKQKGTTPAEEYKWVSDGIDLGWLGEFEGWGRTIKGLPRGISSNEKLPVVGKTTSYGNTDFIYRYDDNFSINVNSKGRMKAYIDNEGNLVPPNIYGKGSIQSQVRGSNPEKSPYISFTAPKYSVTPKNYGKEKISIDINRLEKDVSNNKLLNVEILRHDKVISELNNKLNIAKQRYVDNPSIKNKERLMGASKDLSNARRDGECLIKGCIPAKYILKEK